MYEVSSSNISCLKQNYSIKEVTLITCNNKNKKRLVVKAKEKDRI